MPRYSFLRDALKWFHPKDDDRNLFSATFHMVTITFISMSMADLNWYIISGDVPVPCLTLGEFFWYGYDSADRITLAEFLFITPSIVNMMRTSILLCFMGIIFSLIGFFLDLIAPKTPLYRMMRRYAVPGTCTVLWIMAIVSVSYYVVLMLEDSLGDVYPKIETTVSYGLGFYVLAAAGGVSLIGIFYNLILVNHTTGGYYNHNATNSSSRDDDRCLIVDGFGGSSDDALDTFTSLTPPPPYNIPPPPYTP